MKKRYKLLVIIIVLTLGVFLVKQNVTATKELKVDMGSSIALEIKSEVVQKIYSDLIYLDGDFIRDDFYKYTYFQFENDEEGFWYPIIDEKKCIKCNKCRTVCPLAKNELDKIKEENQT